jgi:hypothetical protein
MGRKALGDRPMTVAERKARSRATSLGALVGEVALAQAQLRAVLKRYPTTGPKDVRDSLVDLDVRLELISSLVPRS